MSYFKQIVACDFEYEAPGGARPYPVAMAAEELLGGRRRWQLFEGGFGPLPPFDIGPDTLFISYQRRG